MAKQPTGRRVVRKARESRVGIRSAMATGVTLANEALRLQEQALRERNAAIRRASPRSVARAATPAVSARAIRAAGAPSPLGVLLAEGDSWFDYPLNDVLKGLKKDHGFDIESVAGKGDTIEEMAYDTRQSGKFIEALDNLLRIGRAPRAILLSGGGNDLAGREFHMLLDHVHSPSPGLNADVVRGVVDTRLRHAYITLICAVTRLCRQRTGRAIPILVHGYDRPVPDGRGFFIRPFPGPWLKPGFDQKGFTRKERPAAIGMMADLIGSFNGMLDDVSRLEEFGHVHYVNLLGALSSGPDYKQWWANELHPTKKGFKAVAARFAKVITGL